LQIGERGLFFGQTARLYPPASTAWFTGSAVRDDSQFFATAT
jgi:hypothetical protein